MSEVPESVNVKQVAAQKRAKEDAAAAAEAKVAARATRREQYQRAAKYAAEYKSNERDLVRLRRQAKAAGNYYVEPEPKLMFVIHIPRMRITTKKILQLLR